jgi:hypothetical protein
VLSSSPTPRDWASRRRINGRTTTRRPASAARGQAAEVVVLPTPPARGDDLGLGSPMMRRCRRQRAHHAASSRILITS